MCTFCWTSKGVIVLLMFPEVFRFPYYSKVTKLQGSPRIRTQIEKDVSDAKMVRDWTQLRWRKMSVFKLVHTPLYSNTSRLATGKRQNFNLFRGEGRWLELSCVVCTHTNFLLSYSTKA